MRFLARHLAAAGLVPLLASPAHLRWLDRRAHLDTSWWRGPVDAIVRFFPGDWLPLLPRECAWRSWFAGSATPVSNPPTALLVQSKRFPLVWEALRSSLPTWRALLPETRDPRQAPWRQMETWILKPALGRAGEGVGARRLVDARAWRQIERAVSWFPGSWAAQRRFEPLPVEIGDRTMYPCLGVYTIGDRVVGAYGRLADRMLIDAHAQDAAVLVAA
jgi:glutathionylspermidine synthase